MTETRCNRCGSRWHTDCHDPANVEPVRLFDYARLFDYVEDEDGPISPPQLALLVLAFFCGLGWIVWAVLL